jgi:roadblock/LC7 domain-containing protein
MNTNTKRVIITATLVAAASATAAIVPTQATGLSSRHGSTKSSSTSHRAWTPNDCIALNGGDFNACNVGNSGRGDLPYQSVTGYPQFRAN